MKTNAIEDILDNHPLREVLDWLPFVLLLTLWRVWWLSNGAAQRRYVDR